MIEETGCDVDGNLTGLTSYEYEYDADGNKIKEIETHAAFSITSEYEYDANGNVTKFTLSNSDVEGFYTDEYEYDANGNMIKDIWTNFDADGNEESSSFHEYEYEYDANGNKIKEISDIGFVTFVYEYENEYDENGNIIKYTRNNANEDGEVFSTDRCEYKYDNENRLLSETLYDSHGVVYHEYDEHGNNIRYIQYSTDEFIPSFCEEYKYMELQEYLAAKESIDAEEIEIETVIENGDSIESILSGLGISLNNN